MAMHGDGIRLLFRCKLCKSIENMENFSEHKKRAHLTEFRKIMNTFVVFEEICVDRRVTELNPAANNTFKATNFNSNQLTTGTVPTASSPSYENVKFVHYENGEVLKIKEEPAEAEGEAEAELNSEQTSMHCPDDSIGSCNFIDFDVKNEQEDVARPHVDTYDDGTLLNSPPVSSPFSVNQNYSVPSSTETETDSTETGTEALLQFQYKCKLCSKLFTSEPHVKLHVGICQLYNQNPQNQNQNQNQRNVPVPVPVPINSDPNSRPGSGSGSGSDPDPNPFSVCAPNSKNYADPSNPVQITNLNLNQYQYQNTQYNLNPMINYSGNEYAKILKNQNKFKFHNLTPKAFKDKNCTPRKERSPKSKSKPKHGRVLEIEIPKEDKTMEMEQTPKPKPNSAKFTCGFCSQPFIRKCNLEQHFRTHHSNDDNVVFKCQDCEFTSKYPACITQHMSAKHGKDSSYYSIDSNPVQLIPH